ncbi:MAG: rhodanese-like domain-containing protein [Pseudomonadota bacterium]
MKHITNDIGNIPSHQCWEALKEANTALIDVRCEEEWKQDGLPDLSSMDKEAKQITWIHFSPFVHSNNNFIAQLENEIEDKNTKVFFICKSGGRSMQAANAALEAGYLNCFNISDGFLGNMFDQNLENLNQNGWVHNNLPWRKL